MRFLLRVAFWLGVVLVLLPSDETKQAPPAAPAPAEFSAAEAASAASATVSDMRQFCARQPDACAIGSQAAVALGHRAQAGARMLYEFISEKLAPDDAGAPGERSASTPHKSQNTLTPADVAPQWRGPGRKDAGKHPA